MNESEIKFLVIDDDPTARETVVSFLKSNGFEQITECTDGEEGFKVLQNNAIDFVICDWEMPNMDGLELVKKLRSMEKFKDLPFMMITSPIRNENIKIEDAASNGVDAYLIKPFRARMLMQKIREVIYEKDLKKKNAVIVADDDDMVRGFVVEVLKNMDFDPIFQFNKASDAYQFLEKNFQKIALVISDWEMPEMTGIEFLHKIRINRQFSNTPFIMITSQTSIEHLKIQKAIKADVDNYLMKPFNVETLKTKIKLVLTQVKLEAAINRTLENAAAAAADSDWSDAEKYYEHVRTLDPKNLDAILGMALVELNREQVKGFEEAVRYFRLAISINPKDDRSYIQLALAYEKSMSLDKATACLREGQSASSTQDQICYHLGRLLVRRGKNAEGIIELEKAVELNPRLVEAKELLQSLVKEK